MFDISFGELVLVAILGVVFIGPKELPIVARAVARAVFRFKHFLHEVKTLVADMAREAGVEDIKREMEEEYARDVTMIKGEDGTWYPAYDISDFIDGKEVRKTPASEVADEQ